MARLKTKLRETAYRFYITDALYCISDCLVKKLGGLALTKRFSDIISDEKPSKPSPTENMTQEEVVDKIWSKIGG